MARTREGEALTEAHRLAQVALSQRSVADFLRVWALLDAKAINASFPAYYRAAKLVIDANRRRSTDLAAAYLDAFRRAEGVTTPLTAARAAEIAEEQARTSLLVTGPVQVFQGLKQGRPLQDAMQRAMTASAGAVTRHVLSAGRETIEATVQRDESALGVARVTDGSPCYFCAMLASRGAVYKSEMTAGFDAHDHCGCGTEPVYGEDWTPPARTQRFAEMYSQSTSDATGADKVKAFRRAYEGRA